MSMVVARMQKMKSGNLVGIGNHNQRRFESHSNKDIDMSLSNLNYDLVNRTQKYKPDIEKFINENKASSRAVRKDAVLVNEWIVTSDNKFFEGLNPKQTKEFFEAAKQYFSENYGEENIRYAQVHLDERTPHMHLGIVPMTEDKRLSAKTIFNRQALQTIQKDLPDYLRKSGFEIERGQEKSERKHLTVKEYKELKDKERLLNEKNTVSEAKLKEVKGELNTLYDKHEDISKEIEQKEKQIKSFTFGETQEIEKKPNMLRKEFVSVRSEEIERLEKEASMAEVYKSQYDRSESQTNTLKRKIWSLETELEEVKVNLGNKLKDTEKRFKSVVYEYKDRWEFAKAVVSKFLKRDLTELYEKHSGRSEPEEEKTVEVAKPEKEPEKKESKDLGRS